MSEKVTPLKYSADSIRAALIALKGAERGPATFEAVAPVFSALIASGGSKAELQASSAQAQVFRELHSEALKTPTAKAFRATSAQALQDFKANGRAVDQASHDARLLALSAGWCSFFKDAKPRVKPEGETPKQVIARLEAERAALIIERDQALAELAQLKAESGKAPAPAPAPAVALM